MNAQHLLKNLRSKGVQFQVIGDRIRYQAPYGILTERMRSMLKRRKDELLPLLRKRHASDQSDAIVGPEWLREAVAVAGQRSNDCFLCKWISASFREGELHPSGHRNALGEDLFPVHSQIDHLRLEYGLYRAKKVDDG